MVGIDDSACSDVEFASSDEEEEEIVQPSKRHAGIDTYDSSVYKFAYNYGKKGYGKRVYVCISHKECRKRLEEAADILLGCGPKKCKKLLHKRYADVPELISLLPDHVQLKNHKTHLKSKLAGGWEIKNIAKLLEWAFPRLCSTHAEFFIGINSHLNCGDFDSARDAEEFYRLPQDFQ
ncbi:hypothetical protein PHMEG_00011149 [Phytophthora megakarya]|uniref:Uncharacterized protein n=1 Tax=Phytophthora megakarya TaxID=4795 RepID=A0A225WCF7_9STRA|nr:hypothetical protein PHMEG_00011149 [Phytophthora megakarya]